MIRAHEFALAAAIPWLFNSRRSMGLARGMVGGRVPMRCIPGFRSKSMERINEMIGAASSVFPACVIQVGPLDPK